MKEKLIVFEDSMTDKDIIKSLIPFFNDIYAHKRGVMFTNDFRSVIVVFDNIGYAKVCERNGYASHTQSAINILRYKNNDNDYLSEEDMNNPFIYRSEQKELREQAYNFRFSASKDDFLLDIAVPPVNNQFQLKILRIVIKIIQELKQRQAFAKFTVNLWSGNEHLLYSSSMEEVDVIQNDDFDDKLIQITEKKRNN